jgi:hypothetical protein
MLGGERKSIDGFDSIPGGRLTVVVGIYIHIIIHDGGRETQVKRQTDVGGFQ